MLSPDRDQSESASNPRLEGQLSYVECMAPVSQSSSGSNRSQNEQTSLSQWGSSPAIMESASGSMFPVPSTASRDSLLADSISFSSSASGESPASDESGIYLTRSGSCPIISWADNGTEGTRNPSDKSMDHTEDVVVQNNLEHTLPDPNPETTSLQCQPGMKLYSPGFADPDEMPPSPRDVKMDLEDPGGTFLPHLGEPDPEFVLPSGEESLHCESEVSLLRTEAEAARDEPDDGTRCLGAATSQLRDR